MISGLSVNIRIGDFEVIRAPEVWIVSERYRPLTRMGIVLPDADRELFRSIPKGDAVSISIGYRDQVPGEWAGTVDCLVPGNTKDQICVLAVGIEKPIVETRIIQSWADESPEAIVQWAVGQSGLSVGRIDSPGCVFPRFVAPNISVWDVAASCAETCQRGFDIDMSKWALWVDADGAVNWGDFEDDGDVPVIETGEGLIRHTPMQICHCRNVVETFLIPGFRHSRVFKLDDSIRAVHGSFRALKVLHSLKSDKVRTFVSYEVSDE